jgi:hypothetical protein
MSMSCNSKSSSYKTVHPKIAFLWSAGVWNFITACCTVFMKVYMALMFDDEPTHFIHLANVVNKKPSKMDSRWSGSKSSAFRFPGLLFLVISGKVMDNNKTYCAGRKQQIPRAWLLLKVYFILKDEQKFSVHATCTLRIKWSSTGGIVLAVTIRFRSHTHRHLTEETCATSNVLCMWLSNFEHNVHKVFAHPVFIQRILYKWLFFDTGEWLKACPLHFFVLKCEVIWICAVHMHWQYQEVHRLTTNYVHCILLSSSSSSSSTV